MPHTGDWELFFLTSVKMGWKKLRPHSWSGTLPCRTCRPGKKVWFQNRVTLSIPAQPNSTLCVVTDLEVLSTLHHGLEHTGEQSRMSCISGIQSECRKKTPVKLGSIFLLRGWKDQMMSFVDEHRHYPVRKLEPPGKNCHLTISVGRGPLSNSGAAASVVQDHLKSS